LDLHCSSPTYTMAISVNTWALAVLLFTTGVLATEFDYTDGPLGPENWGDLDPAWATCKTGMMQSPLEITAMNMVTDDKLDAKLKGNFPDGAVPANISNNGHTIELAIPVDATTLKINNVEYKGRQMHFHYPSEHTIMGYTFPLELHLVHLHEVSPGVNKIAVIGWLFTLGEESPFLNQFINKLPHEGEDYPIDPVKLLSSEGTYGRYMGSLTTPPCTENVTWTLKLWDFPTVSQHQLDMFKAALPHPNARPVIPAKGRNFYIST